MQPRKNFLLQVSMVSHPRQARIQKKKKKDSRMKKSKKYPLHQMTLSGTISECIKYSRKRDENPQFYRKKKKELVHLLKTGRKRKKIKIKNSTTRKEGEKGIFRSYSGKNRRSSGSCFRFFYAFGTTLSL